VTPLPIGLSKPRVPDEYGEMPTLLSRLAAILPAMLLSGCLLGIDAPEESNAITEKRNDVLQASVGGFPWEAKREATTFASVDLTTYAIGGSTSSSELTLRLVGIGRTGTYPIGGSTPPFATARYVSVNGEFGNITTLPIGTITVNELTPQRIAGTFAFNAPRRDGNSGSISITGGTFSIAVIPAYSIPISP
jgi:hypothetical protein